MQSVSCANCQCLWGWGWGLSTYLGPTELRKLPVEPWGSSGGELGWEGRRCYRRRCLWRAIYVSAVRPSPGPPLSDSLFVGVPWHDFCFPWAFSEAVETSPGNLESQRWSGSQGHDGILHPESETGSCRAAGKQVLGQGGD